MGSIQSNVIVFIAANLGVDLLDFALEMCTVYMCMYICVCIYVYVFMCICKCNIM